MNSIYCNADPTLLKLFERAGNLRKVLCAPLDFAKETHAVMFCNGMGDVLKKAFYVPNSPAGVECLVQELTATCHHRGIALKHAFFGGEDTPSYAENFTAQLRQRGYLVARVNAFDAKRQRENLQASNDELDLHGIAHCLLKGRARVLAQAPQLHHQLRLLVRERDFLVHSLTALLNRLHPHVDRLFPGFLNPKLSGIVPHQPACWWLLSQRFSAPSLVRRDRTKLIEGLQKFNITHAEETVDQLQAYAAKVLPPQKELLPASQVALERLVEVAQSLQHQIELLEPEMATLLLQSPGARLTTIPGLGLALSAGLAAELCVLGAIPPLAKLCSYGGIIPATQQSGGPDQAPRQALTFPHCNYRLKSYLLQAGEHMAQVRDTDAWRLRQQAEAENQHTLRVLGKHAAGVIRCLLLGERAYLPARLYDPASSAEDRARYYQQYWPKLMVKWRGLAPLPKVFDPAQPLGRWRQMAQEVYALSLPLSGSSNQKTNKQAKDNHDVTDPALLEES